MFGWMSHESGKAADEAMDKALKAGKSLSEAEQVRERTYCKSYLELAKPVVKAQLIMLKTAIGLGK